MINFARNWLQTQIPLCFFTIFTAYTINTSLSWFIIIQLAFENTFSLPKGVHVFNVVESSSFLDIVQMAESQKIDHFRLILSS